MPASISMITLGVSDLARAVAFYDAIGFKRVPFDSEEIAFFEAGGPQLALFPRSELAKDARVPDAGSGFSGVTLAQNFTTAKAVDDLLALAVTSGGTLIKAAEPVYWGGYSGYFADPDGHLWEVACGSAEYAREQRLMRFPDAVRREPAIEDWMQAHDGELGDIARRWFKVLQDCGSDVREVLHDGHPTACVGDAAFAYVNAFKAHVNVGFFRGAEIADPEGLLQGTGKFMRHVKLRPGEEINTAALEKLIETAYNDMKKRVGRSRTQVEG